MMKLSPDEHQLIGQWLWKDGRVEADAVAKRINALIASPDFQLVDTIEDGWTRLYLEVASSRLFRLTYPESELHGGGPPMLTEVTADEARDEFKL